jgi:hypothetical protein
MVRQAHHERISGTGHYDGPCPDSLAGTWSSLRRESRRRGVRDFASRGAPPYTRAAADGEDCLGRVSVRRTRRVPYGDSFVSFRAGTDRMAIDGRWFVDQEFPPW